MLGAVLVLGLLPAAPAQITGDQVKRAVRRGVAAVTQSQRPDGTWLHQHYLGGETCLASLALLQAGESPDSRAIAAALPQILALTDETTYVVALKIMVLARVDAVRYRKEIEAAARWLMEGQGVQGLWSYTTGQQRFDHSNSQFALLGLHAAAEAGVRIPGKVWKDALAGVIATQRDDGGWSYQSRGASYGSMTAAVVADLLIMGLQTDMGSEEGYRNGAAPRCGSYRASRPLAGGLTWLGRNFVPHANPRMQNSHTLYWLYAVERCGILSGQRYFGTHDWYREGAEYLVRTQGASGLWNGQLVDTCFALLFLAKGHTALVIQKLQWADDETWNPDRHDVEHLVAYIGDKLGEPVAWQIERFDAPLEDWLAAPLLYVQGHRFPSWNAPQREKLRQFVQHGGTLLLEACCSTEAFAAGFTQFAAATFPDSPIRELGPAHAVYHAHFDCTPNGLVGLDLGCRTSVIFAPRDMSCLWEQGDIPELSEQAYQLGTNIAAYAVGRRPLLDRLDVVALPEADTDAEPTAPPPRDALRLGQVVYAGDWRPFPQALVRLSEFLQQQGGISVVTQYKPVQLTDPDLASLPVLYMAGRLEAGLTAEEATALASHLRRGGFVLVDNCCGPEPFDSEFRALAARMFPDDPLTPLPADHPIFRGQPGFDVRTVRYGPDVQRVRPGLNSPELWGIELDGRLALVYSPFALGCGLGGQEFDGCWGLTAADARRLTSNIVLYALTH